MAEAAAGAGAGTGGETVRVVVRCRPPNTKEITEHRGNCVTVNAAEGQIAIANPDTADDIKTFSFDNVYDAASTQRALYEESAFPLVESVLGGYNGTIFACVGRRALAPPLPSHLRYAKSAPTATRCRYGQTGSGKTWSMSGLPEPPELRGIIPNSFDHIFEYIRATSHKVRGLRQLGDSQIAERHATQRHATHDAGVPVAVQLPGAV